MGQAIRPGAVSLSFLGDLEGILEKFNRPLDIRGLPQEDAHPPTLREDVVWLRAAGRYQLVPDFFWKRNVHEKIAVHVADFSPAQPKFRPTKPVRLGFDTLANLQGNLDSLLSA